MANATILDPEETPMDATEKASGQLLKLVGKVIDTGVGPLSGSIAWAEDRLARVQGTRYAPNAEPTRKVRPDERDDIDKTIKRLIIESVEAASVNGFVTGLGGFIAMPVRCVKDVGQFVLFLRVRRQRVAAGFGW